MLQKSTRYKLIISTVDKQINREMVNIKKILLPDPLPPTDINITMKENKLQVDVILPLSENNNVDELHLHGYTDTSESIQLAKVQPNVVNYIFHYFNN